MRKIWIIKISILILFLQSCHGQKEMKSEPVSNEVSGLKTEYSFLDNYQIIKPPFVDSTNFDHHKNQQELTDNQIKLLKLNQVFGDEYVDFDQSKIGINYIIDLSSKFKTIAFYFYFTENELSSTLVNYDSDYNVIDKKTVAMDEIAESILRTESLIEKENITLTNFKFFNETIKNVENIEISENGKFKTRR